MKKYKLIKNHFPALYIFLVILIITNINCKDSSRRVKQYHSTNIEDALKWQSELRVLLAKLLKMEDQIYNVKNTTFNEEIISVEKKADYSQKIIEINSTSKRRIEIIYTTPNIVNEKLPAVVCIAGHGGDKFSLYEHGDPYHGFAEELGSNGYVTISTNVGQHEPYESGRSLMGERLWDLWRCVDYLESLDIVDKSRIGCAGLSLGGEMAMWLAAMDERIKVTVSSGFLTYMDQMENDHCMCWKFEGLRELVDFSDIYSLIAPRYLQCQNGLKEPSQGFTPDLAKRAMKEIEIIYRDFDKGENLKLVVHKGGHEMAVSDLNNFMSVNL